MSVDTLFSILQKRLLINTLSRDNLSVSGRWCNLSATSAIGALAISIKAETQSRRSGD